MNTKALSLKTLFAAGALALGLAAAPAAQADVSVGIGLGVYPPVSAAVGWGGYDNGYGGGYGGYQGGYQGGYGGSYQRPYPAYGGWVNCRDARRILWRYGYSGIEVQSCRPGFYRYTAWRKGKQYLLAVDGQGDVSKLRRIY